MTWGCNKYVMKSAPPKHDEYIDRIRKSFYFGGDTLEEEMEVSRPLAEYASELFSEPHKGHSLHRLNRVTAGSVHTTPCSLIMALIYLDRLNSTDPSYVRRITPHELFIVSMMVSTKFYADYDEEIYLGDWADDGDVTEERLKQLEREFLNAINWNIYISTEQFLDKLTKIEHTLAMREGLRRGWLTYTELVQMLPSFTLVKFLFNNITVMAVSYTAGVMTIAGAFLLASQLSLLSLQRNGNAPRSAGAGVIKNATTEDVRWTTKQHRHNKTSSQVISATSVLEPNTSYALNVEAELLKLDKQYHDETLLEEARNRRNEVIGGASMDSFSTVERMTQQRLSDSHRNWLSLKEEYSDEDWQNLHNLSALQALRATIEKIIVIAAFVYGQRSQFKQLREHRLQSTSLWCGRKAEHASAAFLILQIFIVYKSCGNDIFSTTIYLKELLI